MKNILIFPFVILLAGCSVILPKPHDPVMFDQAVEIKLQLTKTDCVNKDWSTLNSKITKLSTYTTLRNDPQAESLKQLQEALKKANDSSNQKFCESVLNIQKSRVDVVLDAWKGRR
jgi:hypothetical protein